MMYAAETHTDAAQASAYAARDAARDAARLRRATEAHTRRGETSAADDTATHTADLACIAQRMAHAAARAADQAIMAWDDQAAARRAATQAARYAEAAWAESNKADASAHDPRPGR